jgi:hypothetical protein
MIKLSTLANIAEIVGVIIVIGGLVFALLQVRQIRQQRRELAAIELFRFFGNPSFAQAYKTILHLPPGMSADDIKLAGADIEAAAMLISTTMENIGVMTFQRIVPFQVVKNLIGSSTIVLWDRLAPWATSLREELGTESAFEWFQWLADRLKDHQDTEAEPAYIAEKDWLPRSAQQQL